MTYDADFAEPLKAHMHSVLAGVVQTFGQAGVALPERQYIAFGQTAHDADQVTVSFQQMYLGPPGDQAQQPQRCESPRTAALTVEIVRCIPAVTSRGGAPTPEALTAAAEQQAIDAWLLMEAAANLDDWLGVLADVTPTEAQGQYQAVTLSLIMAVK